jgi:hypothetical protein
MYLGYVFLHDYSHERPHARVFGAGFAILRAAAGVAAIWAGIRGGSLPFAATVGLLATAEIWRELMRRLADPDKPGG